MIKQVCIVVVSILIIIAFAVAAFDAGLWSTADRTGVVVPLGNGYYKIPDDQLVMTMANPPIAKGEVFYITTIIKTQHGWSQSKTQHISRYNFPANGYEVYDGTVDTRTSR